MSHSRLFKILYYLLDRGHATAPELAREFEVSVRTIYRDVEMLSGAGIPVYTEPGRNGGICLLHNFVLDKAMFSEPEKQEILTALQTLSATGYSSGKGTLTKLSALFQSCGPDWLEVDFSRWGRHDCDNAKFELLKTAVIRRRAVKFVYINTYAEKRERTVHPLKLSFKSKEWYLKAFCLDRQDFRIFKLNRILEPELLEASFAPLPYPEPQETEQPSGDPIVLRFSKEIAYRIYDEFDGALIEPQETGDFLVSAEMPVDSWLVGYLLSFGTQVEVMEPKALREGVATEAWKIQEKYKC
ncbi:MAG: YafY family protein [Lachnospiraceae bacterium]|nr:YafY family protein [Lachnospiraceae bacterium]